MEKKSPEFAFLVHPRNLDDVYRRFPVLKFFPRIIVRYVLRHFRPIVLTKVTGLVSKKDGLRKDGLIITLTNIAEDMLADRKFASKKVVQAVKFAKKKGVKIVGLGALTSPVVGGGKDLIGKYGVAVTNGNALTAAMTMDGIKRSAQLKKILMNESTVAVVGATGSIGEAVSLFLAKEDMAKELIIIGRTPEHLDTLLLKLKKISNSNFRITISTDVSIIKKADVVIVATSSRDALIKEHDLKKNALIYDITQPQNVSISIKDKRKDILVVDGAIVQLPDNAGPRFNIGLPYGTTFACLAETMILAAEDPQNNFSIGKVKLEQITHIARLAETYDLKLAPLRSWGDIIPTSTT